VGTSLLSLGIDSFTGMNQEIWKYIHLFLICICVT
jgi:hypothetical protein